MSRLAQRIAELRADYAQACRTLEDPPGSVHLLGIGGVGVAGVAVQLAARGYRVSGCDGAPDALGPWLASRGIPVLRGHDPLHLSPDIQWLVRTPAVADDEPELQAARARGLPVYLRGVVLPALLRGQTSIAVGGTHGKTTTSAMIAHVFRNCGVDASFCIGGEVPTLGGVAQAGSAGIMVVEADESDGTLALYETDVAVITNVELDHVDFFSDEAELDGCFATFAAQARRAVIYCADDAGAVRAARQARARTISYGLAADADWTATNLRAGPRSIAATLSFRGQVQGELALEVPGLTNLLDAMAAVAAAVELGRSGNSLSTPWGGIESAAVRSAVAGTDGRHDPAAGPMPSLPTKNAMTFPRSAGAVEQELSFPAVASALRSFRAVRRRFDVVAQGRGITVVSDYAHHPTEIAAFMQQVRGLAPARVLAVFQAHRYSRTAVLGPAFPPAFTGVDELILVPVYAASEDPVPGGTLPDLYGHFQRWGNIPVITVQSLLEAWDVIRKKWRAGDVVLVIGAGDVEQIAFLAAAELNGE